MATDLSTIIALLRRAAPDLTAEEIADILWLAPRLPRITQHAPTGLEQPPAEQDASSSLEKGADARGDAARHISARRGQDEVSGLNGRPDDTPGEEADAGLTGVAGLHTDADGFGQSAESLPFRTPAAPALPGRLELARAMRPLRLPTVDHTRQALDEEATVRRIAESDLWVPVLRPAERPWFEVALVVDGAASLDIWRRTVADLRQLLERHSAFHDVRLWRLSVDGPRVTLNAGPAAEARPGRPWPGPLLDPEGRRLVLVISDCVAGYWHNGVIARALAGLGRRTPVSILQVLPEAFWPRTALRAAPAVTTWASAPGRLRYTPPSNPLGLPVPPGPPVPILTLEPEVVVEWARLMAGASVADTVAYLLDPRGRGQRAARQAVPGPEERVDAFLSAASPEARRLAALLAASQPLNFQVARLVHSAMLPRPSQVHLAEVFLSGLLARDPAAPPSADPDTVRYTFHPGVAELLRASVPVADTVQVLQIVSAYIRGRMDEGEDFIAWLRKLTSGDLSPNSLWHPFATVAADILSGLGGVYADVAAGLDWALGRGRLGQGGPPSPGEGVEPDAAPAEPEPPADNEPDYELLAGAVTTLVPPQSQDLPEEVAGALAAIAAEPLRAQVLAALDPGRADLALNQSIDLHEPFEAALAAILAMVNLKTGWLFIKNEGEAYRLAARHQLPPAIADPGPAWAADCDCQELCEAGKLDKKINMVRCSRLRVAVGDKEGLAQHASLPLRVDERTLGILNLATSQWGRISPSELRRLTSVSEQMSAALARADLYEAFRSARARRRSSRAAGAPMLRAGERQEQALQRLAAFAARLLDADAAAFVEADERGGRAILRGAHGWELAAGTTGPVPLDPTNPHLWYLPERTTNLQDDALDNLPAHLASQNFQSHLGVGIFIGAIPVGTLIVDRRDQRPFLDRDEALLQVIAGLVSRLLAPESLAEQDTPAAEEPAIAAVEEHVVEPAMLSTNYAAALDLGEKLAALDSDIEAGLKLSSHRVASRLAQIAANLEALVETLRTAGLLDADAELRREVEALSDLVAQMRRRPRARTLGKCLTRAEWLATYLADLAAASGKTEALELVEAEPPPVVDEPLPAEEPPAPRPPAGMEFPAQVSSANWYARPGGVLFDTRRIEEARWAVVINAFENAALIKAIWPLIAHRMDQMGHKAPAVDFRDGENAGAWLSRHTDAGKKTLRANWGAIPPVLLYRPGERVNGWLARMPHSVANGPVDPRRGVPFYLMLVGRPGPLGDDDETFVPFTFQYELDFYWAVGRICFTDDQGLHRLSDYASYAERLVEFERRRDAAHRLRKEIVYFATRHEDDKSTERTADELAQPLVQWSIEPSGIPTRLGFTHSFYLADNATRAALERILQGGPEGRAPALLFTATHGLGLPPSDERLPMYQGALILGDWSGLGNVKREHWFAGEDLAALAGGPRVEGMLAFLFASYSVGCPDYDEFVFDVQNGRPRIAPFPLIAQLPQQLLINGALGVIGNVERAWSYSFSNDQAVAQSQAFEAVLGGLMSGLPVGAAMEPLNTMQGARAQSLVEELENIRFNKQVEDFELARLWMARNALRNYLLVGDPAARLPF